MVLPLHELLAARDRENGEVPGTPVPHARSCGKDQWVGQGVAMVSCMSSSSWSGPVIDLWVVSGWLPSRPSLGKVHGLPRQPCGHVSTWIALSHGEVTKRCVGPTRD